MSPTQLVTASANLTNRITTRGSITSVRVAPLSSSRWSSPPKSPDTELEAISYLSLSLFRRGSRVCRSLVLPWRDCFFLVDLISPDFSEVDFQFQDVPGYLARFSLSWLFFQFISRNFVTLSCCYSDFRIWFSFSSLFGENHGEFLPICWRIRLFFIFLLGCLVSTHWPICYSSLHLRDGILVGHFPLSKRKFVSSASFQEFNAMNRGLAFLDGFASGLAFLALY